jgi:hypothetical protein
VDELESEAAKIVKLLAGRKTAAPRDAYAFLEKTRLDLLAYILAESSNGKAVSKVRNYLNKWRPLRQALPSVATELEALGLERGPKFDKVLEDFFQAQLLGKGRKPEEHPKLLRKLAGIKEPPKKVEKEEKKKPEKSKKNAAPGAGGASAAKPHAVGAAPATASGTQPTTTAKAKQELPRGKTSSGGKRPPATARGPAESSKQRKR